MASPSIEQQRGGDVSDDDEEDVDVGSDDDDGNSSIGSRDYLNENDKKAHHNALERKRRDHIKESFSTLRDCLPTSKKHDRASRAQILRQATDYIQYMARKNSSLKKHIDEIRKQNQVLMKQVQTAEHGRPNVRLATDILTTNHAQDNCSADSDGSDVENARRPKRQKVFS